MNHVGLYTKLSLCVILYNSNNIRVMDCYII